MNIYDLIKKADAVEVHIGKLILIHNPIRTFWFAESFVDFPKSLEYIFTGTNALQQAIDAYETEYFPNTSQDLKEVITNVENKEENGAGDGSRTRDR